MAARFSLVVFDLDGTLVDTAEDIAAALNATLLEAGFSSLPTSEVIGYIGDGAARLIQRALPPINGADLPTLVGRFRANYAAHVCDHSRLYPGVGELLARLAPAVPMAVVTNKPGELARALLQALGIDGTFRHIIGDGDGFARKPAPDAARWVMDQQRATPVRTLLVGDGLPDMNVAAALGCLVAAATWGYTARTALEACAPAFLVDRPGDLADLIVPVSGPPTLPPGVGKPT